MHFDFSRVQSVKIKTDVYLLQLIIDNIIRNALLYAPEGSTITISSSREDERIMISVCDMGPGISETDMEKILEPFVRGDTNISMVTKGSGLGLSISHWAIDLLEGSMRLENQDSGGLCVNISIPCLELS